MDLVAEGEALRRPCVYLTPKGSDPVGVWGGRCAVSPEGPGRVRHWLTVDTRAVPALGYPGGLSVFTDERGAGHVVITSGSPPPVDSGTVLFATSGFSLPPVEAVFQLGSETVRRWLQACEWDAREPPNEAFPDLFPVEEYAEAYQKQLPLYAGEAHAVLGGWHFPWPDGDWQELLDSTLLVWTFEECEPWLEVWSCGERRWVTTRVT